VREKLRCSEGLESTTVIQGQKEDIFVYDQKKKNILMLR